jgi:two-component system, OmpR family, response regulator
VLVVDDEPAILETVSGVLRDEGFVVDTAATARDALALAVSARPDLVVLDVMLPDLDGIEITRRLRAEGRDVAVLFLTARDSVEDRVIGLRTGGDDYLTKPFSLDELVERVRAVLRRTRPGAAHDEVVLRRGDLVLDVGTREVWRNGTGVHLTATEFDLLRYFATNPLAVLSKAQILAELWPDDDVDDNAVETFVSYLRKKLDRLGPPLIHTVRLVGYSFRPVVA